MAETQVQMPSRSWVRKKCSQIAILAHECCSESSVGVRLGAV